MRSMLANVVMVMCVAVLCGCGFTRNASAEDAKKKVYFVAGGNSHEYGGHEHAAGCMLLAKILNEKVPAIDAVVYKGWPAATDAFANAASIVIFCDGGGGHVAIPHMKEIDEMTKKGVGFVCLHYAVEVPKGEPGDNFVRWMGGYFETFWSVNPHWTADFKEIPKHAITRGVKPFTTNDEWYYHMRFHENMEGVTPILTAIPPESTRAGKDDAHGGNQFVRERKGQPEHVAWAFERADGGRGFGVTGSHVHWNWGQDDYRKLILNAIAWSAKIEIPENGIESTRPTVDQLMENITKKVPANFNKDDIQKKIEGMNTK